MGNVEYFVNIIDGVKIALTQEGEVAGFKVGDRIKYSKACHPHVRGKVAMVVGFSFDEQEQRQIWTQPDGQDGCHSTRADFAKKHLIKIA